ncbi:alpha-(1,3)-fucosyltransferase 7-like [Apostichopus japonicus]|uniref:alpha-(1,3)-fucosyltransferase 7-like n=1 Tax=Stichopus japonicus TaxID=307972 RepID=UPI003AB43995
MEGRLYTTIVSLLTFILAMTAIYWENGRNSVQIYTYQPPSYRKIDAMLVVADQMRTPSLIPVISMFNESKQTTYPPSERLSSPTSDSIDKTSHQAPLGIGGFSGGIVTNSSSPTRKDGIRSNCVKQIQLWSKFAFAFPEQDYDCANTNCKARYIHSNSYQRLATSHAVILHHKGTWRWEDIARNRPDGQMWIYMSKESPLHSRKMKSENPSQMAYNWSMTFHTDSEVTIPYGRYFGNSPEIPQSDNRNWAAGKTRLVAWMASNCGVTSWGRTKFVRDLQKYVQVDTYGACGKLKCPRNSEACDRILSSHKFYLSLENSECEDYITEKFWDKGLRKDMVPIVYGTTRKDYEKVAPPYSFIHISDYKNMSDLADYIKYLDKNDTAYNEYFEWKKKGSVESYNQCQAHTAQDFFCGIVKKLEEIDEQVFKTGHTQPEIMDINNWWRASCHHRKTIWST